MIVPQGEGLWAPLSRIAESQHGDERGRKRKGIRADTGNERAVGPRQVDRPAEGPHPCTADRWGSQAQKNPGQGYREWRLALSIRASSTVASSCGATPHPHPPSEPPCWKQLSRCLASGSHQSFPHLWLESKCLPSKQPGWASLPDSQLSVRLTCQGQSLK